MNVNSTLISVHSSDPERLTAFYANVVGLAADDHERSSGEPAHFHAGNTTLLINGHSDVCGTAPEPERLMLNFIVRDVAAEQHRLTERGVRFVRKAWRRRADGVVSTFVDPDGNYCQLIESGG